VKHSVYSVFLIYMVGPEDIRGRSGARPCENCYGKSDTGRCFSPSSWVFPCQYHSVSVAYSSRAALMRRTGPKTLDKAVHLGNREHYEENVFLLSVLFVYTGCFRRNSKYFRRW